MSFGNTNNTTTTIRQQNNQEDSDDDDKNMDYNSKHKIYNNNGNNNSISGSTFNFDKAYDYEYEELRLKEGKVKLIVLSIIGLLTITYGAWNVWRMVEAVKSPVAALKTSTRTTIPVPGVVMCGKTLDRPVKCYKSAFNFADDDHEKGESCDDYVTNHRMDASHFKNMNGFDNLDTLFCYIFNPSQKVNGSYGEDPLLFNEKTQKVNFALWSSENANNTLGAITADRWFFYGIFNEQEDPTKVRFQIVKMPSISYLYYTRTEIYNGLRSDAIIGGVTASNSGTAISNTDKSSASNSSKKLVAINLETKFTSFDISGFGISPNLWELFRVIPEYSENNDGYQVNFLCNRIEFTLLQLAANMGGFVSILSAIYFILFGSRRVNPWGIMQRYVLKTVPSSLPVYSQLYSQPGQNISSQSQQNLQDDDDNDHNQKQRVQEDQNQENLHQIRQNPNVDDSIDIIEHQQPQRVGTLPIDLPIRNVHSYRVSDYIPPLMIKRPTNDDDNNSKESVDLTRETENFSIPPPQSSTSFSSPSPLFTTPQQSNLMNYQQNNPQSSGYFQNHPHLYRHSVPTTPMFSSHSPQYLPSHAYSSQSPPSPTFPTFPITLPPPPPPSHPLMIDLDDSRIQKLRNELKADVQRTIAAELTRLRLFLSKYYLKDVFKTE